MKPSKGEKSRIGLSRPEPKAGISRIRKHMATEEPRGIPVRLALDSNENAFGPSPYAVEAARAACFGISKYVEHQDRVLVPALAERYYLYEGRVAIGCGSDDLLSRLARAYLEPGSELLRSANSYLKVPNYAFANDALPVNAPDKDFAPDVDAILGSVTERTRMVYLANPDNPSGAFIGISEIRRLRRGLPAGVLLVVDCAYAEYVSDPDYKNGVLEFTEIAKNVVVTRTFSKVHGLAGARVGWVYGSEEVMDALNRIGLTFRVATPSLAASLAALDDWNHPQFVASETMRLRKRLAESLRSMGLKVYPSEANFVLAEFPDPDRSAAAAAAELRSGGIAVRRFTSSAYKDCLRITIGTEPSIEAVEAALDRFLRSK